MSATLATNRNLLKKKPPVQIRSSWPCGQVLHISKRIDLITRDLNLWALKKVWGAGRGGICEGSQVLTIVYFSNIECSTQEIKVSISMWRRNKNTYVWMIVNRLAILPVRVRPGIDVNFIWSHMSLTFWGLLIKCLFLSSFFLLWTSWNISYFHIFLVWTLPKLAQGAEPIAMPRSARRYPKKRRKKAHTYV